MKPIYDLLLRELGSKHWWPADTPFEVVIGAVLTQQTRWENVERAINNLKDHGLIEADSLSKVKTEELEELIRCTGFYRQKALRLKNISKFFDENPDILRKPPGELREVLLSLNGVGEETADSIVLYAADKPKFVIDAYTKRICKCMGIEGNYMELQSIFEGSLPVDVPLSRNFMPLSWNMESDSAGKKDALNAYW